MSNYTWTSDERITKTIMDQMLYQNADGESADDLTKLAVKDQSGAGSFATQILISETLTADRALTITLNNAARTIDLSGDLTLAGSLTTDAAVTFSGAHACTLTLGAASTLTLPSGTETLVGRATTDTLTNKTLTAPAITGGTAIELTTFSLRSSGAAHDLVIATSAVYGADRTLTINIPTGANAALTLTGDLIRSGAHSLTLTTTATTDVTLPTSGTLVNNAVATLSSLVSVSTITTGTWNATTIAVGYGGTGTATLTDHGVLFGSGAAAISASSAGTSGQPLMSGGAAADPDWGTLGVNYGGTGATTLTDHGILLGSGTGAVTPLGAATNGQLPIGSTGADPTLATITATANETSVANGAGTITIGIADDIVVPVSVTIPNTGLHILDTNASHDLIIKPGTDISADRTLTVTTGDADRTLTLGGNSTVDQDVSTTGSPTFANVTDSGLTASKPVFTDGSKVLTSSGTLGVDQGGTGATTLTDHGVVLGSGTAAVSITAAGTSGQPLMSGGAGADPNWGTLGVNYGGTGATTLTDHGILLGSGTGAVTPLGSATNGQIPIGSTGADPVLAAITGTANQIVVTGGAGTITLSCPQSIHSAATPTFAGGTFTGDTEVKVLNLTNDTTLTIATGVITATQSYHAVDTEAAGATDDLDGVDGGNEGDILIIFPADATHSVVAKHGAAPGSGEAFNLAGGADFTMDEDDDFLMLLHDGTVWQEISRSENHA